MPQYFADIKETEFFLMDAEAHHACAVARHQEGDEIRVFDGTGRQYMGRIDRIQKKFVRGTLLRPCPVRRPALELELPIMSQWSYPNLKIAPCRYQGSAYQNDLILLAHNYSRHFGQIHTLEPGDTVCFTDADGTRFMYEVSLVEQLERTAIEEMESGDWDLTLFTCTVGGAARVTVRCQQTDDTAASR